MAAINLSVNPQLFVSATSQFHGILKKPNTLLVTAPWHDVEVGFAIATLVQIV